MFLNLCREEQRPPGCRADYGDDDDDNDDDEFLYNFFLIFINLGRAE